MIKLKDILKENKVNEIGPGPFGTSMAIGLLLKALYQWYKKQRPQDKQKFKDFAEKL
jgi:uncharacterized protein YccT (UPF0319 family)